MDQRELMQKFREMAKEHGWNVDWDYKGDQHGNGDEEYQVWLTPADEAEGLMAPSGGTCAHCSAQVSRNDEMVLVDDDGDASCGESGEQHQVPQS